jgi:hypothetical protein
LEREVSATLSVQGSERGAELAHDGGGLGVIEDPTATEARFEVAWLGLEGLGHDGRRYPYLPLFDKGSSLNTCISSVLSSQRA